MRSRVFSLTLRLECEDDVELPSEETLAHVLAHSTATEALSEASGCECVLELAPPPAEKAFVICEVSGGVLQWTHPSNPNIKCYTLDHDNIDSGDRHDIPDQVFLACNLDPECYRREGEP